MADVANWDEGWMWEKREATRVKDDDGNRCIVWKQQSDSIIWISIIWIRAGQLVVGRWWLAGGKVEGGRVSRWQVAG